MALTRRAFLISAAGVPAAVGAALSGPPGLEIYSLRREMQKDVPGTLALIRSMGFTEVEVPQFYGMDAAGFRKALGAAGLTPTAMVATYERLSAEPAAVWADLRTLGARWAILPWLPHDRPLTLEDVKRAADRIDSWGRDAAAAGLGLAYHPHGYEFGPSPDGTLFDTLVRQTDSRNVAFQLDAFWAAIAGQDCVTLLRRYPRRFRLMHLKDLRKGLPTGDLSGTAPDETSVAVGSGALAWPAILKAARSTSIERYYIEDESPAAATQIPESLRYLRGLRL